VRQRGIILPKNTDKKPQREMTKRALSHWQKENRIQRISLLVGVIVIAAVLIIVGTGVYAERYRPLQAPVIKVGDASYSMDYYINMLAYYGATTGSDFVYYVTDQAAQQIQMNRLIKDAAEKLDPPISVSDEEVEKVLKERELASNQTFKDVVRVELILDKLKKDYFDKQVPQSAEQRAVLAMFLEGPKQVAEVKAKLEAGGSFNDIATELSRENNSKSNGGDFGWVPKGVLPSILASANTTLENKVFSSDVTVNQLAEVEDISQSKNIGYWLLQVTETRDVTATVTPTPTATGTTTPTPTPSPVIVTEKHLKVMLLPSQEKAAEIKAKLEAGGEGNDWATLADANSSYTNPSTSSVNGGDLGFVSKDNLTLGTAVKDVLFPEDTTKDLPVNQISDPVADSERTTTGGIWLIKITGIEANKAIEGDNRDKLVEIQQNSWVEKLWTDNQDNLKINLTDAQKQYAVQKALERL
jgi:parvulin-like peptidyl-prolyl isomerase